MFRYVVARFELSVVLLQEKDLDYLKKKKKKTLPDFSSIRDVLEGLQ